MHTSSGFDRVFINICRLLLSALLYNENCDRPVIMDEDGKQKMRVEYLKYKSGVGKAKFVRPPPTKSELIVLLCYHLH